MFVVVPSGTGLAVSGGLAKTYAGPQQATPTNEVRDSESRQNLARRGDSQRLGMVENSKSLRPPKRGDIIGIVRKKA